MKRILPEELNKIFHENLQRSDRIVFWRRDLIAGILYGCLIEKNMEIWLNLEFGNNTAEEKYTVINKENLSKIDSGTIDFYVRKMLEIKILLDDYSSPKLKFDYEHDLVKLFLLENCL